MHLLLDTHALLWFFDGDARLSADARAAIEDPSNTAFVSAASAWEIATKHRLGKLPLGPDLAVDLPGAIVRLGFAPLAVTLPHAQRAGGLEHSHRDPCDRMLIAQAVLEDLMLVSNEALFDEFGVKRLW